MKEQISFVIRGNTLVKEVAEIIYTNAYKRWKSIGVAKAQDQKGIEKMRENGGNTRNIQYTELSAQEIQASIQHRVTEMGSKDTNQHATSAT